MRAQRIIWAIIAAIVIATMVLSTCLISGPPGPVGFSPQEAGPVATGPADAFTATPTEAAVAAPSTPEPPAASPASAQPAGSGVLLSPPPPTVATPSPTVTPAPGVDGPIGPPPDRDLNDLTRRLKPGGEQAGTPVALTPVARNVGDQETFHVADQSARTYFSIQATLVAMSPHAYMYVENGLNLDEAGIQAALDFFEQETYPKLTDHFKPSWVPRINGDDRVTILNARVPGVGGYFSSADAYSRFVNPRSNEREMIYLNVDAIPPGAPGYDDTLAHEFTHLLQWHLDNGEETWINEGSAEIGAEAVGASASGGAGIFLRDPDLQLTAWRDSADASIAHYGAAYLFLRYVADHFGGYSGVGKLLAEPADGVDGVEQFLRDSGASRSFDEVFADWVIANYLNDQSLEGGRFAYQMPGSRARAEGGPTIGGEQSATVHQYGARYYEVQLPAEDVRVTFDGAAEAKLVPHDARSGRFQWWSNRGDSINSRLTRRLDLTRAERPVLKFWTWFDIEADFDYAYVEISTDDGKTWQTLAGQHTTTSNPNGGNFGNGYTGQSGGGSAPEWVEEEIDLAAFAGREVLLRFEYVTDDAFNLNGIGIDDLRVEGAGLTDDAEAAGDWQAEGFVRILNRTPQRYAVQVIELSSGATNVHRVALDAEQDGSVVLPGRDRGGDRAVVVVSGLARDTLQPAEFRVGLASP